MNTKNTKLTGGFLKQLEKLNEEVTIDAVWDRFVETGRIDAFKFDWKEGMDNKPHFFWDSDVFKWMEGACNIIGSGKRPDLTEKVDMLISRIEEHQEEDGYFNIYFTVCEPNERFKRRSDHELYCAGHLFEAAVAHYYATGSDRLIKVAEKYAACIEKAFVTDKTAAFTTPGHEEIELALIKLYLATGNERHLRLCEFFLTKRGNNDKDEIVYNNPALDGIPAFQQDNVPLEDMSEAVGHAVRCLYLLCGMADFAALTSNDKMFDACKRTYNDIVTKKMYITGGVGASHYGESFSVPYDLPNEKAYAETCAAISLMMFSDRMCRYTREAKYADTVERTLYNGIISGLSLSGDSFFYENPLEINLAHHRRISLKTGVEHMPITQRPKIFGCSCCPPNLNRVLSSLGDYIYDTDGKTGYVNQFADSVFSDGAAEIIQKTNYPNDGKVILNAKGLDELKIRIPSWCSNFKLNKNYSMCDGYAVIENDGSEIVLEMEIKPVLIQSRPEVTENIGKAALMRGPVVYCVESVDNGENIHSLILTGTDGASVTYNDELRSNIIELNALKYAPQAELYGEAKDAVESATIKFIPYYAFANRGESDMLVWLNYRGN
jgi:DUF1680 family protein